MDALTFCMILAVTLLGLAVAAFAAGPYVLQWFFETLDKWADIIDGAKDEK